MYVMKSVRERIRAAMQRAGVTQEQLAGACGVTGPAVNQWLTGKTKKIDPGYLVDVAACTNASLNWLMTGKGDLARRSRDPLSSVEENLLNDFRKLTPKVRVEVSRLVKAIAPS
jgi:transcriptional regulator with XRE-family HTH domain